SPTKPMARKNWRRRARAKVSTDRPQLQERIKTHRLNEKTTVVLVSSIFLVHSLGLAFLFAPLFSLFDDQPLIDQDWGLHFHHLKSLEAFWRQDRSLWGYNPFFMSGYPSNTIQDLSIKFFEFVSIGLSAVALTPIQWFKITAFLSAASVPWVAYFAARNLFEQDDVKNIAAPSAALLGTIYWWNSLPREMFFYGMVGYPAAAYLSLLGVSLFYRLAKHPASWSPAHLGWILFAIAILPLHVQSALILLPALLSLLIAQPNLLKPNLVLWIMAAGVISLLANLTWLVPAFTHRHDDVSSAIIEQLSLFVSADPLTFFKDYLGPNNYWSFRPSFWEKGVRLTLLLLGLLGLLQLWRGEHKPLGAVLIGTALTFFTVTYFGSMIPFLKGWQPLRFKIPYDLVLVLAAAYSIARWVTDRPSASPAYVVPVLLLGGGAFLINLATTESLGKLKLRTQVRPEISAIVDWVRTQSPADARVLFEESGDETGFVYDGMYLSSFIPHWTGRQLIGGPINLYNDRHHFAEFHSGKLFKRDIQTLDNDEIKNYLRLYNVGAVVAFHPASIQRLLSIPGLVTVDRQIGPIFLMKVDQPLTWFLQGAGNVKSGPNRLEISDVRGNEITLKYHWIEGLAGSPAVIIIPVKIGEDPIPFIKVVDPPAVFTLQIGK
ncbi:MAG TPA: hypothetical protein VJ646_02045, partial [Candidatus Binatia bacterium]|nr:hypothetical protein [Candidatus Binatia bacterium]